MKILELCLYRYSRMRLKNIDLFVYKPKAVKQIIIGTNGSGKSSLMFELSPLPANPKNYLPGGYKTIKIEHKGSLYELSSKFEDTPGKSASHSFIKDGEELNPGKGNVTTQIELVHKYFGLTPKIHELLLGVTRFHSMPVAIRREWLTLFSDANYEYGIQVYNKLRERARDISGAIKLAKKELANKLNNVYSEEDLNALDKRCQSLYETVRSLQEIRIPENINVQEVLGQVTRIEENLLHHHLLAKKIITKLEPHREILDELEEAVEANKFELKRCNDLSNQYFADHKKLSEQYRLAEKAQANSIEELKQKITSLEDTVKTIISRFNFDLPLVCDPRQALVDLRTAENYTEQLLLTLINHRNKGFTVELRNEIGTTIQCLGQEITAISNSLENQKSVARHLESLRSNDAVECPNCKHHWIQGFDPELLSRTNSTILNIKAQLDKLQAEKTRLDKEYEDVKIYVEALTDLNTLVRNTPSIADFWNMLLAQDVINTEPGNLVFKISNYMKDILDQIKILEIQSEIQRLTMQVQETDKNKNLDFGYLSRAKEELEENMQSLELHKQIVSNQFKLYSDLLRDKKNMQSIREQIEQDLNSLDTYKKDLLESNRRSVFNEMLRTIQSTLASQEQILYNARNQNNTILNIEMNIKNFEQQERCLKAAAKELSPTEGLIAEGLFGFMKLFIQQMNNFIKRIWSYPLVIQPCALGTDGSLDLDYRFPVVVDTADNVRKDISEGSSAMHEVIDLGFRIAAMKALHLEDFPLFLDEFGSTMDPAHKTATIYLINSIMEQDHFSQLFMISHDTVQYGALSNTEVCVLSADNMNLPKNCAYNQHVQIN